MEEMEIYWSEVYGYRPQDSATCNLAPPQILVALGDLDKPRKRVSEAWKHTAQDFEFISKKQERAAPIKGDDSRV